MFTKAFMAWVTIIALMTMGHFTAWGNSHDSDTSCRTTGGLACLFEDDLQEAINAAIECQENNDCDWFSSMIDSRRCIMMKKGLKVRIKDGGFFSSEIYLFPPGEPRPIAVFTYNDNFDC